MIGPFDFLTTLRSGERVAPSLGAAASLAACCARASGVHVLPVITAAAPMTAFLIKNERRSNPAGGAVSFGEEPGLLASEFCLFIIDSFECEFLWSLKLSCQASC